MYYNREANQKIVDSVYERIKEYVEEREWYEYTDFSKRKMEESEIANLYEIPVITMFGGTYDIPELKIEIYCYSPVTNDPDKNEDPTIGLHYNSKGVFSYRETNFSKDTTAHVLCALIKMTIRAYYYPKVDLISPSKS